MARNKQPRKAGESAVEMAIAAIEDSPRRSPLDMDMSAVDPDPTCLDLPQDGDGHFTGETNPAARGLNRKSQNPPRTH